jgi:alcohol dehydrogenase (cytochrome c)
MKHLAISAVLVGMSLTTGALAKPAKTPALKAPPVYQQQCAHCHGADLKGGKGPALTGDAFLRGWERKTARNLYSRIISTMPTTAPGSLPPPAAVEITAYLLRYNRVDLGATPPKIRDDLTAIRIQAPVAAPPAR